VGKAALIQLANKERAVERLHGLRFAALAAELRRA
jgi:hypothetical protein